MSRARPSLNCQARRHVSSDDVASRTQFSARWAECLHCWQQLQAAASGYLSYLLAAKPMHVCLQEGMPQHSPLSFQLTGGSSGCQRWRATSVCQSATIESVQNGRARKQESTMKTSTKYAAPCWRLPRSFSRTSPAPTPFPSCHAAPIPTRPTSSVSTSGTATRRTPRTAKWTFRSEATRPTVGRVATRPSSDALADRT